MSRELAKPIPKLDMEEHFLNSLIGPDVQREEPRPWYNPDGDCIIYQVVDEAVIADRIDEVLTIYKSAVSGKPIGYQIKGVLALARIFGWDGIMVACASQQRELKEVSIFALLLAAYEQGPKTIGRRSAYAGALESFGDKPRINFEAFESAFT